MTISAFSDKQSSSIQSSLASWVVFKNPNVAKIAIRYQLTNKDFFATSLTINTIPSDPENKTELIRKITTFVSQAIESVQPPIPTDYEISAITFDADKKKINEISHSQLLQYALSREKRKEHL